MIAERLHVIFNIFTPPLSLSCYNPFPSKNMFLKTDLMMRIMMMMMVVCVMRMMLERMVDRTLRAMCPSVC